MRVQQHFLVFLVFLSHLKWSTSGADFTSLNSLSNVQIAVDEKINAIYRRMKTIQADFLTSRTETEAVENRLKKLKATFGNLTADNEELSVEANRVESSLNDVGSILSPIFKHDLFALAQEEFQRRDEEIREKAKIRSNETLSEVRRLLSTL